MYLFLFRIIKVFPDRKAKMVQSRGGITAFFFVVGNGGGKANTLLEVLWQILHLVDEDIVSFIYDHYRVLIRVRVDGIPTCHSCDFDVMLVQIKVNLWPTVTILLFQVLPRINHQDFVRSCKSESKAQSSGDCYTRLAFGSWNHQHLLFGELLFNGLPFKLACVHPRLIAASRIYCLPDRMRTTK